MGVRAETLKLLFVYGNISFVIVAGFYVLYQFATGTSTSPEAANALGLAALFGGFVGTAIQFLTGSEIATRASRAATASFTVGASVPPTTPTPPGG